MVSVRLTVVAILTSLYQTVGVDVALQSRGGTYQHKAVHAASMLAIKQTVQVSTKSVAKLYTERPMSPASQLVADLPSVAELSKGSSNVKQISAELFKKVDIKKDGGLDRDEMTWFFVDMEHHNIVKRLPTSAEVKKMEILAGADVKLGLDDFEAIVTETLPSLMA